MDFSGRLPALPQIPGEPEKALEAGLDEKLFNFDAIEALLDENTDEATLQTKMGPASEQPDISSDKAAQEEEGPPVVRAQKNLDEIEGDLREISRFLKITERNVPVKLPEPRPSLTTAQILVAPTSRKMAEQIKHLIDMPDDEGENSKEFRAINMIRCAAGALTSIYRPRLYPETEHYAQKLSSLPDDDRYEFLKDLYDELKKYLPEKEERIVRNAFGNLYSNRCIAYNSKAIKIDLISIQNELDRQLQI